MDRTWINGRLFSREHVNGVKSFMDFIGQRNEENAEILCPCTTCLNQKYHHQDIVRKHLLMRGMSSTYTRWIHHGENLEVEVVEHPVNGDDNADPMADNNYDDSTADILSDLYRSEQVAANQDGKQGGNQDANSCENGSSFFADLMREAKRELYPGCKNMTKFSFVVKMLHLRSYYRISNNGFSAIMKFLAEAFPPFNTLPKSYNEAKNLLSELGLGYVTIHACINNCVLFRKRYAKHDNCPVCGASRWQDQEKKKIPQKVLRHFPLAPRLKRLFVSKKSAEEAQWHKLKRQPKEKEMCHPADGEAWKDFDRLHPDFAKDARNLRLGIATDGFNPFGNMSSSYSMWPVFVVPYNLPPWLCMDQSNLMLALLIPGPKSPGKNFDIFLEPLVDDLLELWTGVRTYDALSGKMFTLHAAVLWCIHDYPALSTLSGRTTRGYFACLHCDKHPLSVALRNKIGYIGHYRFLPRGHRLRRNNEFAKLHESNDKPGKFTAEELVAEVEKAKDGTQDPEEQSKKRKRSEKGVPIWGRRVSLWDLPYWKDLKLRHNLDVMHIEKNVCDNLLGTILNIEGKTKDTINARLDLEDMGIREDLHLQDRGNTYEIPEARYTLSKDQKIAFCEFLRQVMFPDGYASNIARCISADGTKVHGLKTHDCHILLQRILPAGMRGFLDDDIYQAIAELGKFFRELCSKNLNIDVLTRMKGEIPIILCKLEKIFPPAFFDVMVHLAVHLPEEAILRGPVHFGWMYPIERRLYTLKRYVRNMARPEGSIAEAYIAEESLTFCSKYLDDVETRFNREPRNKGFSDESAYSVDVFGHGVNLIGSYELKYVDEFDQMVWYVLNNSTQAEKYVKYVLTSEYVVFTNVSY